MKRKASGRAAYEQPAKLRKESTKTTIEAVLELSKEKTVQKAPFEPLRLGSFRQRKAPSWLSSYVTNSTVKETPKHSSAKDSPLLVKGKSKTVKGDTRKESENTNDNPSLLRKQKTVKVTDSSNSCSKAKSIIKTTSKQASLSKKPTEILSKSNSDSVMIPLAITETVSEVKNDVIISESVTSCMNESSSLGVMSKTNDVKNEIKLDFKEDFLPEQMGKPTMLEVVICISTSGAMQDYLDVLQDKTREMVWRLQSLIPNLRIGVFAHTQGGIHDDKVVGQSSSVDHNYIRTGGHSGTKWLDLGATYSQICGFVGSLEPEATVYPDYVQDNLEMALWKLQRCMSWSSCSYRTVIMLGRGRPNRTSFYLQREHWRGWIRSALEISKKTDIPVIDWELEAKLLAQMGIHVFTIQALPTASTLGEEEEDEGSLFFRRVAEITNGLNIRLNDASKLIDILVGVCCACYGPDLLQEHRDLLRDENDGVVPEQLKDIFISLQLHSKRRSLCTMPSVIGDLSLVRRQLAETDSNGNKSGSEEDMSDEECPDAQDVTNQTQVPIVTSTDTSVNADVKSVAAKPRSKASLTVISKKVKAAKVLKVGSKKMLASKRLPSLLKSPTKKVKKPVDKPAILATKTNKNSLKNSKSTDKVTPSNKKKTSLKLLQQKKTNNLLKTKINGTTKKVAATPKSKLKPIKKSSKDSAKCKPASKNDSKQKQVSKSVQGKAASKKLQGKTSIGKTRSVPSMGKGKSISSLKKGKSVPSVKKGKSVPSLSKVKSKS
ncbi:nucleolar protein dao-5 [Biomphalaria glabrata]|nr:nucleolar protein dao-5 [Biomphalaria glabrata]